MKKIYLTPTTYTEVDVEMEQMIALSLQQDVADDSDALIHHRQYEENDKYNNSDYHTDYGSDWDDALW